MQTRVGIAASGRNRNWKIEPLLLWLVNILAEGETLDRPL
ncbi:hypothetical protein RGAI101_407 [Roseobacter sp. GAI101]|nr:hypothetical protein RGAI101_407 [Roseobacter sp. GAI101]